MILWYNIIMKSKIKCTFYKEFENEPTTLIIEMYDNDIPFGIKGEIERIVKTSIRGLRFDYITPKRRRD